MIYTRLYNSFNSVFERVLKLPASGTRLFTNFQPLNFKLTPNLLAEPLKKKRRIDPAVVKAREERKRKRLEKLIRRLEKNARQLKPIEECEIPIAVLNEKQTRTRMPHPTADTDLENQISILKSWASYKYKENLNDVQMIDRIMLSQQWALDNLQRESESLYQKAIEIDEDLIPFKTTGPVETPPISEYDSPDGEYIDITKKWDDS